MISPQLLANVKQAEGLRLYAYIDTLGNATVGYGHKLAPGHDWTDYTITSSYAEALLNIDLDAALLECTPLAEWLRLGAPARQDAVIELVYNMGLDGYKTFTRTRNAMATQQWQVVHDNLLVSLWAKQVGPTRSNRIANQFLTGSYTNIAGLV
jgi:GH24 family phage-related lysozyme (muramidase)